MTKRLLIPLILVAVPLFACSSQKTAAPSQSSSSSGSDQPAAAPANSAAPQTFTGEIMDSACASMGGSHEGMMKQAGAKDAKECTLKCVAAGSKFVLFDPSSKTTYELDDQTKARDFAGQKVKVTGTFDSSTKTISIHAIEGA